jgi:hypothetical protein
MPKIGLCGFSVAIGQAIPVTNLFVCKWCVFLLVI